MYKRRQSKTRDERKEEYLYSAILVRTHTLKAQIQEHTEKVITACKYYTRGWLVGWGLTALLTQNRLKVPLNPNQPTNTLKTFS